MNMPAEQSAATAQVHRLPTAEESSFALAVRKARALSAATLVPEAYRGEDKLPNVMIALEIAERIGASPLQVMQNLYVVQGKPGWSSSFLIATVNACGRFTPLRFECDGDDATKDGYRVRAVAKDKETGEECAGTWITWTMVKAEGWNKKPGSKWLTMPEQMFRYRAAAFWTRLYAPEVSLGIQTSDEVQDVYGGTVVAQPSAGVSELADKLRERAALEHQPAEPQQPDLAGIPAKTVTEIRAALHQAETQDALRALDPDIEAIPDDAEREELKVLQDSRMLALQ